MAPHSNDHPYFYFTPPGTIAVSSRALEKARVFLDEAKQREPSKDWLVAFNWGDTRRYRNIKAGIGWQDLGPGIDIVAYERQDVPPQAIHDIGGTDIVIAIAKSIWEQAIEKMIDIDESGQIILR